MPGRGRDDAVIGIVGEHGRAGQLGDGPVLGWQWSDSRPLSETFACIYACLIGGT